MTEISNKKFIIISALVVLIGLSTVVFFKYRNDKGNQDSTSNNSSQSATEQKPSGTPLGILITDPNLKATITSPVLIKGSASGENFDHNAISFKIIDQSGKSLGEGSSTPGEQKSSGNFAFEALVEFSTPEPGLGYIMINNNPDFKFPIQF